ncbi:MAG: type II toxin-antitoxin system PemK/MazF family toxin [Verrucomicrobia bacterium]|nr:MAG: type II toxin-antitoxin system PemK/MazF family toxin [Verrucomicrobiota bacterium]PYL41427.1 MAG: type II toxin-antitoxin system PemK/MazF family toxin [Verrucomicrobiota bacterium]
MSPGSKRQSPHSSSGTIPRMPSTISFSQGDVVLVPFPFTDLSATKQRPALVLSPERLNKIRPDLVLAAITSRVPAALDEDEILLSASELGAAGLPKPSIIKLGKIFTIHQGLIRKKLGNIGEATLENVRQKLVEFMR